MHVTDLVPILQMAIGPVILISGVGLLLLSMTNRAIKDNFPPRRPASIGHYSGHSERAPGGYSHHCAVPRRFVWIRNRGPFDPRFCGLYGIADWVAGRVYRRYQSFAVGIEAGNRIDYPATDCAFPLILG